MIKRFNLYGGVLRSIFDIDQTAQIVEINTAIVEAASGRVMVDSVASHSCVIPNNRELSHKLAGYVVNDVYLSPSQTWLTPRIAYAMYMNTMRRNQREATRWYNALKTVDGGAVLCGNIYQDFVQDLLANQGGRFPCYKIVEKNKKEIKPQEVKQHASVENKDKRVDTGTEQASVETEDEEELVYYVDTTRATKLRFVPLGHPLCLHTNAFQSLIEANKVDKQQYVPLLSLFSITFCSLPSLSLSLSLFFFLSHFLFFNRQLYLPAGKGNPVYDLAITCHGKKQNVLCM